MSPALGAAILLTIGSLTGLTIQLLNDDTPGTGNLSPVSIMSIAVAGWQIAWFVAFLRKKEPRDEKHRRAGDILGGIIIAGLCVYVLVQLANGTAASVQHSSRDQTKTLAALMAVCSVSHWR